MSLVMEDCVVVDSTVEYVGSELASDCDISPVPVVGESQCSTCSILDKLKAPTKSDLARKCKIEFNPQAAIHNIRSKCPSISTMLINTYREASQLFIDGDVIYSEEGTTQGDHLVMQMYTFATLPFICDLRVLLTKSGMQKMQQALGTLACCREWWDELAKIGPSYGYYPNLTKTWLITREAC